MSGYHGHLHHATEPAIAYGDGWSVYAWHGTRIPPQYYAQPVTAQHILHESNAAVRRALIERYGQERFFLEAGATVLDRDPEHGAEMTRTAGTDLSIRDPNNVRSRTRRPL